MTDAQDLKSYSSAADDFRAHFDQFYLGVIPRLLNQEAMFLAFLSMVAAVETLAGAYSPKGATGERFREFIGRYFPKQYGDHLDALWKFRNRMVHAFNPSPFLLVCHSSRMHLCKADDAWMLNAEDFYSDVVSASRAYFTELYANLDLQRNFVARIEAADGGRPYSGRVESSIGAQTPVAQQIAAAGGDPYPKQRRSLLGLGRPVEVRWIEIYVAEEAATVERTFKTYFGGSFDDLMSQLRKLPAFAEMEAPD